jgi:hypothetical protein
MDLPLSRAFRLGTNKNPDLDWDSIRDEETRLTIQMYHGVTWLNFLNQLEG